MKHHIDVLSLAFEFKKRRDLRELLCASIKNVRGYLVTARNGGYDHITHLPCGYQDAWGDKVDRLFKEHEALKIAWDLNQGSNKRFNRIAKLIGEY